MRILLAFCLLPTLELRSQSAEDSVKSVVAGVFKAMYDGDAAALRSFVPDTARMETLTALDGGGFSVRRSTAVGWIESVGRQGRGVMDERVEIGPVLVDGSMAMAWVPYRFYYKGAFSHCGVNVFLLGRSKEGWRVVSVTDTRRREGCPS